MLHGDRRVGGDLKRKYRLGWVRTLKEDPGSRKTGNQGDSQ